MKIAYIVMTCEKYIPTKVKWQKETFFKNVSPDDIYYLSCKANEKDRIFGYNTSDDKNSPPMKYIEFIKNTTLDYDYYVCIDDDTFLNIKNLHNFLEKVHEKFSPSQDLYIGYTPVYTNFAKYMQYDKLLDSYIDTGKFKTGLCLSGGAGFILSNKLYNRIKDFFTLNNSSKIHTLSKDGNNYAGDVLIGRVCGLVPSLNTIYCNHFHMKPKNKEDDLWISYHYINTEEMFHTYFSLTQ